MERTTALAVVLLIGTIANDPVRAQQAAPATGQQTHQHAHEHEHGDDHDEVENIVVTATPLPHESDELATPVDQLSRQDIVDTLRGTLGETVGTLPGVTTSGFTGGASRPIIRGQDAYRTEVLDGGLSTQDASRLSPDHAVPVNPITAKSIEVVRGPGVLRYGGGASAGVVNAITNRVPLAHIDEPVRGETIGSLLRNGDGGNFGAEVEGGVGDFAWHLDGLYLNTNDYETGAGSKQDGSDVESWSVTGGGAYLLDSGRIGFAYTRYESEYGIPEDEPVFVDLRTNRYRFEGEWEPESALIREVQLRGVYSNYTHEEIADGVVGQRFDNDEFDGRLEVLHEPLFDFFGAIGFHAKHQDLVASGEAAEFLAPSDTAMFAGYLFEERPLGDMFDLQLGFRAEGQWVEGTPIDGRKQERSFAPISGSIALVAHPAGGLSIGATASANQRAPSQVELYARGPHEATGTFEIGNPGLDEETSYTGELRVSGEYDRVNFEVSAFGTYYGRYLFGQLTGVTVDEDGVPDPLGDLDQLLYRERDAYFVGGEIKIGVPIVDFREGTLSTEWQLDYVRARFTNGSGNRNVPLIPPLRWGGALVYGCDRFLGRFGFLRSQAQWHTGPFEFGTSAFTMLDLTLRYRLPWLEERTPITLAFNARNLLDEEARNAASFTKEDVMLPGRNYRLSFDVAF